MKRTMRRPANLLSFPEAARVLRRKGQPRIRVASPGERTAGGRRWPSKKHREYYEALELRRRDCPDLWYCIEPTFLLPGGVLARFDFLEVVDCSKRTAGEGWFKAWVRVVDVKGRREKSYVRNKKLVKGVYGVGVVEV